MRREEDGDDDPEEEEERLVLIDEADYDTEDELVCIISRTESLDLYDIFRLIIFITVK